MGVLKKLTDEYFEKTLRKEKGKFLEVFGCRVIVPPDYDEDKFIESVGDILNNTNAIFLQKSAYAYGKLKENGFIEAECKNDFSLMMDDFEHTNIKDVDKTLYDSYMKFMKHILKDVEICSINNGIDGAATCIPLADGDEVQDLIESGDETDIDYYDGVYITDPLIDEFFDEFQDKAKIIRSEILYDNLAVAMRAANLDGNYQIKTLLYAKEMREWWKNKINEVLEKGLSDYFGNKEEE